MPPKISVIVPVYKVEQYLPRCLDSILAQTYEQLEIICVNDGSPDDSLAILERYAARDARIKVISRENGGLSAARNTGLDAATGELIAFVDSDDFLLPTMVETLLRALEAHCADIVNCQFNHYRSAEDIAPRGYDHAPLVCETMQALRLLLADKQVTNHVWRNLYKAKLFGDIRFPVGKFFEDIVVTPQIFAKAGKVVFLSDALYQYRENRNSITQKPSRKQRKDYFEAIAHAFRFVEKELPAFRDWYSFIYIKKLLQFRHELLTRDRRVDTEGALCKAVEHELKSLISLKLFLGNKELFFKILLLGISRPITLMLRHYRVFRYRLMLKFCTGRKRQHYLNKLERESW